VYTLTLNPFDSLRLEGKSVKLTSKCPAWAKSLGARSQRKGGRCALDRLEEGDARAGLTAELGTSDDAFTQMLWRQARAKVLARRGEHAEVERFAREAIAIGEETDTLDAQGNTYADLAEVLSLRRPPQGSRQGARAL
jgi:hypothetical protein